MPSAEEFRALARSSPWLWRSVRFTFTATGRVPVRAWIRRPDALRVETMDGRLLAADPGGAGPSGVAALRSAGGTMPVVYSDVRADASSRAGMGAPGEDGVRWWTDAGAPRPPPGADGLVDEPYGHRFPGPGWQIEDPMWQDYRWVAMLNPLELADTDDGEPAVTATALREEVRHGRLTWIAEVRPLPGYNPRCSCCPLLPNRETDLQEAAGGSYTPPDITYGEEFTVALDRATGICVATTQHGGTRSGDGHEVTIESVDPDLPDDLFLDDPFPVGRPRRRARGAWARWDPRRDR